VYLHWARCYYPWALGELALSVTISRTFLQKAHAKANTSYENIYVVYCSSLLGVQSGYNSVLFVVSYLFVYVGICMFFLCKVVNKDDEWHGGLLRPYDS
jgi:hypothetical protein